MVRDTTLPDRARADTLVVKLGPQQNSNNEGEQVLGTPRKALQEFWEHTRDTVPAELQCLGVSLASWEHSFDGVRRLREQQVDSRRKLMVQLFFDDIRFLLLPFYLACAYSFEVIAKPNAAISLLCLIMIPTILWTILRMVHAKTRKARAITYQMDRISAEADWIAFIDQQKELYRGLLDSTTLQLQGYSKDVHLFGSRHSQTVGLLFRFEGAATPGASASFIDDLERLFQLLQSNALTPEEYETAKARILGTSNTKEQQLDSNESVDDVTEDMRLRLLPV